MLRSSHRLAACAVILIALWPGAASANTEKCGHAKLVMRGFLSQLPSKIYLCDTKADCNPYYLDANPCGDPMIFGTFGEKIVGHITPNLIPLQSAVRRFCPEPDYACSPRELTYDCIQNQCKVLPE